MSQTAHTVAPAVATEGQIIDGRDVQTGILDTANGPAKFGRALVYQALPAPGEVPIVEVPNATGEITGPLFAGITVFDPTVELPEDGVFAGFADKSPISFLRRGRMWVITEDAVTVHQAAFARFVAAGAEELGALRSDVDTADAVAIPGSNFKSTGSAGGLIGLELDPQD